MRYIRMAMESGGTKGKFPLLYTYANWLLHDDLRGKQHYTLLKDISKFLNPKSKQEEDILFERVHRALNLNELLQQIYDFCTMYKIEIDFMFDAPTPWIPSRIIENILEELLGSPITAQDKVCDRTNKTYTDKKSGEEKDIWLLNTEKADKIYGQSFDKICVSLEVEYSETLEGRGGPLGYRISAGMYRRKDLFGPYYIVAAAHHIQFQK